MPSTSNPKNTPLARRLRPASLDEFVGQEEIVGPGTELRRAIESDRVTSIILYGPPGSGKTSLASVVARTTESRFRALSAVSAGVKDVRDIIQEAGADRLKGKSTTLFLDEIHRFNKAQQDALLHAVEDGVINLIGATTENPFFEVNSPLISRCRIYMLRPLSDEELVAIATRALHTLGGGGESGAVQVEQDALRLIARTATGDARRALNILEAVVEDAAPEPSSEPLGVDRVRQVIGEQALLYDKDGDAHYDCASAFIKSMRGSDPDAAVYWLMRMIEGGDDPRFLARRMVIFASEDVGLADPEALQQAVSAASAVDFVGLPEARLNLTQAAIYLALAPKSNSVIKASNSASAEVKTGGVGEVPKHLRSSNYPGAKKLGHGVGYRYPHSYDGNYVSQDYLPDELEGKRFYQPSDSGREPDLAERAERRRRSRF